MQDKKTFNQYQYINDWKRKNKAQFKVELNIEERKELDDLLKNCDMTKVEFVRVAIELLKEGKLKKKL